MQNLLEYWRQLAVESLFNTVTFENTFNCWKKNNYLNFSKANDIFSFGENLSAVFSTTGSSGRDQGDLSGGGNVWECFITWYLNLLSVKSNIVFIKHKKNLIPTCISDAITVNYGSTESNTESDIIAIKFPDKSESKFKEFIPSLLKVDKSQFEIDFNGDVHKLIQKNTANSKVVQYKNFPKIIDLVSQKLFDELVVAVIQCKTNWNDNAQIPMLWDIVYSSSGFKNQRISLGKNGWNINALKNFYYSFVTVPSNKRTVYKPDSTAVKRVTNLSGGNFWGKKTNQSVAKCINELPNSVFGLSVKPNLNNNIQFPLNNEFDYFRL